MSPHSVLLGRGDSSFASESFFAPTVEEDYDSLADVNEDGRLDLVAKSTDRGSVALLLGRENGAFTLRKLPVSMERELDTRRSGISTVTVTWIWPFFTTKYSTSG